MTPNHLLTCIALTLCVCLSTHTVYSQTDSSGVVSKKSSNIRVKARALKNKILLRWAVDQPAEWQKANTYGFNVIRWSIISNGKTSKYANGKQLTPTPLKPKPLSDWKILAEKDNRAAIIATAIYETKSNVRKSSNEIERAIEESDELQMRHTFSLMAADQSFESAKMAGWGFEDTTAKPNQKYIYFIMSAAPKKFLDLDTSYVQSSTSDYYDLPKPLDLAGEFNDKVVHLTWNNKAHSDIYNAYYIEKSEDSLNFSRTTNVPFTNLNSSGKDVLDVMHYTDSIKLNDKKYYYRVMGVSSFGEISPPSKVVSGSGRKTMTFSPNIVDANILNDSTVLLTWEMPKDTSIDILSHFELSQSEDADRNFKVVKTLINKTERKIVVNGLKASNYFIIGAVDKYDKKYESFAFFVQPIDSTPPHIPVGLLATVNDTGVVKLSWKPNTDRDIFGYYVLRANVKGEEMSLITSTPILTTTFYDTLSMSMLNEKAYYSVVALDKRYNQSKFSEKIEVTKPDKNPPVAPVFSDFKLTDSCVHLVWQSSPSADVAFQRLYKKGQDNSGGKWELIKEFITKDSITFTDVNVKIGNIESYTLVAIDSSNNESLPSVPLTVTIPLDKKNKAAVKDIKAVVDRNAKKILVEWTYAEKDVVEYQIYRATTETPFILWKVAQNNSAGIIDSEISPNNEYKYSVRAIFKNGCISSWNEVKVVF